MPFTAVEISENHKVGVWKISETTEELMRLFVNVPELSSAYDVRNLHTLSSRLALMNLLERTDFEINKTAEGRPFISGITEQISLSHSGKYAAAIVSSSSATGIDIEKMDERIFRIAHKFVREDEKEHLLNDDVLGHYLIWNIKESLFKYYGKGAVDFRKHLQVDLTTRNSGYLKAYIHKPDHPASMELKFRVIEDQYLLTWINHDKPIKIYASHSR